MANLTMQSYLTDLRAGFDRRGYVSQVTYEDRLGGDNIILSAKKGKDIVQIRINQGAKGIFGQYSIGVYSSNHSRVRDLLEINTQSERGTSILNREKKQFHGRLRSAAVELNSRYPEYVTRRGSVDSVVSRVRTGEYTESLGALDFVSPAIGIEFDSDGLHPVFGVAVGGNRLGGLLLYDPIDGQVEAGGYVGFGGFGVGGVEEMGTLEQIVKGASSGESDDSSWFDNCSMPDCDMPSLDCDTPDCKIDDCSPSSD